MKVKKPVELPRTACRSSPTECDAPSSLDWRKKDAVTGVKNPAQCGSCWAFSSTGAIEGINAINTRKLISLSEQKLVDCVTTNWGCGGGYMDDAFNWVINNGGIDTEANYPYTAVQGTCNKSSRDYIGVAAKKKKMAKHKFPWSEHHEQIEGNTYQPLQWRTNRFAAMR